MPNWCENKLTVRGEPDRLDAFLDAIGTEKQPLDFDRILPTPEELLSDNEVRRGGDSVQVPGWYEWRCEHWGTKWGAVDCKLNARCQFGECEFVFHTAWRPPVPLVDYLASANRELTFELSFAEPMMGYAGAIGYEHGGRQVELRYRIGLEESANCERSIHFCALEAMNELRRYRYPPRRVTLPLDRDGSPSSTPASTGPAGCVSSPESRPRT
jgi:hypothetical protein